MQITFSGPGSAFLLLSFFLSAFAWPAALDGFPRLNRRQDSTMIYTTIFETDTLTDTLTATLTGVTTDTTDITTTIDVPTFTQTSANDVGVLLTPTTMLSDTTTPSLATTILLQPNVTFASSAVITAAPTTDDIATASQPPGQVCVLDSYYSAFSEVSSTEVQSFCASFFSIPSIVSTIYADTVYAFVLASSI